MISGTLFGDRKYLNKEKSSAKHKVILIGGDHHNGLGLVRTFGVHGVYPYGVIVGANRRNSFVYKSKYWTKVWFCQDEEEALNKIKKEFKSEKNKPVLIPWSDGAEAAIDSRLDELSQQFIVPSINGEQGAIVRLMDKQNQANFCQKYGIDMLESQILYLGGAEESEKQIRIPYPLILKPVTSVEGQKLDIRICYLREDFISAWVELKKKGYRRVLVQRYLEDRVEYVVEGAVTRTLRTASVVSNIRRWPTDMGCGSFSKFETDPHVLDFAEMLLATLQKMGYEGATDIDFFGDNEGHFYLSEINWRSGGRNFMSLCTGVHSVWQYYCSAIGDPVCGERMNHREGYTMNEATDLRHVVFGSLTFKEWWSDRRRTDGFAIWWGKDMRPVIKEYRILFGKLIKRGNRANILD